VRVAELVWRVKLVAELRPGVVTETEVACIERVAEAGLAELGLRLGEAKRLTVAPSALETSALDILRRHAGHHVHVHDLPAFQ